MVIHNRGDNDDNDDNDDDKQDTEEAVCGVEDLCLLTTDDIIQRTDRGREGLMNDTVVDRNGADL